MIGAPTSPGRGGVRRAGLGAGHAAMLPGAGYGLCDASCVESTGREIRVAAALGCRMSTTRAAAGRPPHPDLLTPAEWRVLDLVRHGMRRAEIARRRGTSVDAVKYHLANISGKLGVGARQLRHGRASRPPAPLAPKEDRIDHDHVHHHPARGHRPDLALDPRHRPRRALLRRDPRAAARLHVRRPRLLRRRRHPPLPPPQGRVRTGGPARSCTSSVDDIHAAQESLVAKGVHFTGAPHVIHTDEAPAPRSG